MSKKEKKSLLRYGCYKCSRRFNSWQERDRHAKYSHPIPPPEKPTHVSFIDLVREHSGKNWGKDMFKEDIKHPSLENLKIGMLVLLGEKLDFILEELRKPKTLK